METAYEALYIIDANLPEEQTSATLDKYSGIVSQNGGTVDDLDRMETRRLAYEIKGRREGLYVVMNFRSEPAVKDELERIYHISDDVLRYMVIKQDPRADRFPSQARAAEQERRDRDMAARMAANPPAPTTPAPAPAPAVDEAVTDLAADTTADTAAVDTTADAAAPAPLPEATTTTAVDDPTATDAPTKTDAEAIAEATGSAAASDEAAPETTPETEDNSDATTTA